MENQEDGQELPIAELYLEAVRLASTVEEGTASKDDVATCVRKYESLVERLAMYGSVIQSITTLLQHDKVEEAKILSNTVVPQFDDEKDFCQRINNMFVNKLLKERGVDSKNPDKIKEFVEQSMTMFQQSMIDLKEDWSKGKSSVRLPNDDKSQN